MLETNLFLNPESKNLQFIESLKKKVAGLLDNHQFDILRGIINRFSLLQRESKVKPKYSLTISTSLASGQNEVEINEVLDEKDNTQIATDEDTWPEPDENAEFLTWKEIEESNQRLIAELQQPEPVYVPDLEKMNRALSFEPIMQKKGTIITSPNDEIMEAIRRRELQFVYQKGIGFFDGNQADQRFIETSDYDGTGGFGSCVVFIARDPETKKTALAHCDNTTDVAGMFQLVKEKVGPNSLHFSVLGGQDTKSELLVKEISQEIALFSNPTIENLDILGPTTNSRQAIFDSQTGTLYDLPKEAQVNAKPWSRFENQPQEVKSRAQRANQLQVPYIIDIDKL